MIFQPTKLEGVYVIETERLEDDRGFFGRTWCQQEFAARGLNSQVNQASISFNKRRGTLRGLHYQEAPHGEIKLVRVTRGAIFDVVVDLRPESPTFKQWTAVELDQDNRLSLYIPDGFAHGFETLSDNAEVLYQISTPYVASSVRGVRWNDPAFGIQWPIDVSVMAPRDRDYADCNL
ncbi:MAG: dTDP-4-dehydrorhamnose 3,5-epimerase [Candidatus Paceibacterota bacterium]